MAVLSTGNTYATGNQVTATNLNNAINNATFAAVAVDNSTTQLSGGAIIVKDGGITSGKLAANISISGTLAVTGAVTLSSTLAVTGTSTLAGIAATAATAASHDLSSAGTGARLQIFGGTHASFPKQIFADADTFTHRTSGAATIATFTSTGLNVTGTIVGSSTVATSAGVAWGLGAANSVSPTSPNRTLTVTVAGTTYYIHAKTTND